MTHHTIRLNVNGKEHTVEVPSRRLWSTVCAMTWA